MWETLITPIKSDTLLVFSVFLCTYILKVQLSAITDLLKPKRWEYKSFSTDIISSDRQENFDNLLQSMDNDGYEFVSMTSYTDTAKNNASTMYIFKRPQG